MIKKTCLFLLCLSQLTFASHINKSQHSIQLGGAINTGNTDATNINTKLESEIQRFPWGYDLTIEGQWGSSQGIESARSLKSNAELNYFLTEKTFAFIQGSILYDKFATYDFIIREVGGLGRILIETKRNELRVRSGLGFIHRRVSGVNDFQHEPIINIGGKYIGHLSETAEFSQKVSCDIGRLNTHIAATSSVKTTVIKNLALELSYGVSHDTVIPPLSKNTRNTDTMTKITLVYTIK